MECCALLILRFYRSSFVTVLVYGVDVRGFRCTVEIDTRLMERQFDEYFKTFVSGLIDAITRIFSYLNS